jgi:hypothetical protein
MKKTEAKNLVTLSLKSPLLKLGFISVSWKKSTVQYLDSSVDAGTVGARTLLPSKNIRLDDLAIVVALFKNNLQTS